MGGTTFVGPTSAEVTSIFWNPAALGQLRSHHLYLSGVGRLDATEIARPAIDLSTGEPDPSGERTSLPTLALTPTLFVGGVSDLHTPRFLLGVAVYQPHAENLAESKSLAYHAAGGSLYTTVASFPIVVRVSGEIAIAFAPGVASSRIRLRFDRDLAIDTACPKVAKQHERSECAQRYSMTSDFFGDTQFHYVAGLHLRKLLGSPWTFGLAYVSGLDFEKNGPVEVDGVEGESRVSFRMPQRVHFGVRYHLGRWELVSNLSWIDFSTHRDYDVRVAGIPVTRGAPEWQKRFRGFRDVLSFDVGAELQAAEWIQLAAKLRLETSAVDTSLVTPAQMDAPKVELALGGRVKISPRTKLTVGYSLAVLADQDVSRSAFQPSAWDTCASSGFDLDSCASVREGRALPTAAGTYSRMTHSLHAAIGLAW
ncbi:MAG: hypothetical protein HY698_17620 [Deltaproteobacteria bacterium]|nr:hypothetical protein [Deltaproteobacteria bacterium]